LLGDCGLSEVAVSEAVFEEDDRLLDVPAADTPVPDDVPHAVAKPLEGWRNVRSTTFSRGWPVNASDRRGLSQLRNLWSAALLSATICGSFAFLSCMNDRIENDWLKVRPPGIANAVWQTLPSDRVREIRPEVREEALRLLAGEPVLRLNADEAHRFGWHSAPIPGQTVFLIRAVTPASRTGQYEVLTNDRTVAVIYRALSASAATERSAVVVSLAEVPQTVHVEVSIAW
jgi:hypothetical protein